VEAEILDDVITYLGDEVAEKDVSVLFILIQRAIRKVCAKRYPFGYTDTEKETAVERYRDTIFAAAVYYWAKQGADGESSHSENGISRAYEKEDDIYFDVVPMAKIL
jgi:hypothetical protein